MPSLPQHQTFGRVGSAEDTVYLCTQTNALVLFSFNLRSLDQSSQRIVAPVPVPSDA